MDWLAEWPQEVARQPPAKFAWGGKKFDENNIWLIRENIIIVLIGWPTIWYASNSDEHKYANQEIRQRDPPTKEKHICYISTCDETTWDQEDKLFNQRLTCSSAATVTICLHDIYKRDYDALLQLESYGTFVHFGNISQNSMFITKCWEHCDILTQSQTDHCNIWRTEAHSKIITITILCKHPSPLTDWLLVLWSMRVYLWHFVSTYSLLYLPQDTAVSNVAELFTCLQNLSLSWNSFFALSDTVVAML